MISDSNWSDSQKGDFGRLNSLRWVNGCILNSCLLLILQNDKASMTILKPHESLKLRWPVLKNLLVTRLYEDYLGKVIWSNFKVRKLDLYQYILAK